MDSSTDLRVSVHTIAPDRLADIARELARRLAAGFDQDVNAVLAEVLRRYEESFGADALDRLMDEIGR